MAVVKAKKPVTKLKAGQKKKVNKWIIIGGIAAVAVIGAVVVGSSFASSIPTKVDGRFGRSLPYPTPKVRVSGTGTVCVVNRFKTWDFGGSSSGESDTSLSYHGTLQNYNGGSWRDVLSFPKSSANGGRDHWCANKLRDGSYRVMFKKDDWRASTMSVNGPFTITGYYRP